MNLSEEEKKKFMSMVPIESYFQGKMFTEDLSNIRSVEIHFNEDHKSIKDIFYLRAGRRTIENLRCILLSCNNNDFDFISSIIDKISPKIEITYSSDECISYNLLRPEEVDVECYKHYTGVYKTSLRVSDAVFDLGYHGSIISNKILEALCANDDEKRKLLTAYVSHPETMSTEILDMIKPIYNALPCGEKLLLELGCDV